MNGTCFVVFVNKGLVRQPICNWLLLSSVNQTLITLQWVELGSLLRGPGVMFIVESPCWMILISVKISAFTMLWKSIMGSLSWCDMFCWWESVYGSILLYVPSSFLLLAVLIITYSNETDSCVRWSPKGLPVRTACLLDRVPNIYVHQLLSHSCQGWHSLSQD